VEVGGYRSDDIGIIYGSRQNGSTVKITCSNEKFDAPSPSVKLGDDTRIWQIKGASKQEIKNG